MNNFLVNLCNAAAQNRHFYIRKFIVYRVVQKKLQNSFSMFGFLWFSQFSPDFYQQTCNAKLRISAVFSFLQNAIILNSIEMGVMSIEASNDIFHNVGWNTKELDGSSFSFLTTISRIFKIIQFCKKEKTAEIVSFALHVCW